MTLTFPTLAEQAIADWNSKSETASFNSSAERFGGERDDEGSMIVWRFDDDTSVTVSGRGAEHKIEAHLP